jgi:hypothetical protein
VARLFHDNSLPLHRSRDVHQLVDHHPADPFAPELRRDEEIVEADGITVGAGRGNGNEVADQLSDRARNGRFDVAAVMTEKMTNRIAVLRVDRADEKSLSSHWVTRLSRAQSSLCHAVTAYRENK